MHVIEIGNLSELIKRIKRLPSMDERVRSEVIEDVERYVNTSILITSKNGPEEEKESKVVGKAIGVLLEMNLQLLKQIQNLEERIQKLEELNSMR